MAELRVARWRRFGKDRLYVSGEAGTQVGWVDVLTGERTVSNETLRDAFNAAVDRWYAEQSAGSTTDAHPLVTVGTQTDSRVEAAATVAYFQPPTTMSDPSRPEQFATGRTWHDLSANRPGQAVRQRAEEELAAMKQRTRVGTFIARTMDAKTDERAWRVGADGEESVGARLDKLSKHGWHVLHSVPVGSRGSDIDHVLIGHGGIYTINTKRHPGGNIWVGAHAIRVNGQPVQYLRNSRFEASRAERLLSQAVGFPVPVRPAIVFLTGTVIPNLTIKQMPTDVFIFDRMDVPGVFKRAPHRINAARIATIYDYARRCTTWTEATICLCTS